MRTIHLPSLLAIALVSLAMVAHADDETRKQKEIRKMVQNILQRLYEADPKTKAVLEGAAGYAIVSNIGVKILVLGSGKAEGIAVNNKSKSETFMKRIELQAGLGFGVTKFRSIFVFDNENALNRFITTGWEFGGQPIAAAKAGHKCGAMSGVTSVSDGVWVYQLIDKI